MHMQGTGGFTIYASEKVKGAALVPTSSFYSLCSMILLADFHPIENIVAPKYMCMNWYR